MRCCNTGTKTSTPDEDGRNYDGAVIYAYDIEADMWSKRTQSGQHVTEWHAYHGVISAVTKGGEIYVLSKDRGGEIGIHLNIFDPGPFTFTCGPDPPSNPSTVYSGFRVSLFHGEVTAVGLFREQGCLVLVRAAARGGRCPPRGMTLTLFAP